MVEDECPHELQELLKTVYGLSPQEATVLTYLCENDARISEVADALDKDRSTVQRYVSSLKKANLVSRRSVTTDSGKGRYFVYTTDKEQMKGRILDRLEDWTEEKRAIVEAL